MQKTCLNGCDSNKMNGRKDILDAAGLHETPFTVPEGYFESLKRNAKDIATKKNSCRPSFGKRIAPYVAIAASFAAIIAAGSAILKVTAGVNGTDDEAFIAEYIVPVTEPESVYYLSFNDADELTDEEIVEYLIESGVSLEEINEAEQE